MSEGQIREAEAAGAHEQQRQGHILFQDGVSFTRRAYARVGGINRQLKRAGDWDLWVRLARRFRFHRVDGHVSCFRVRTGQLSHDMDAYRNELHQARAAAQVLRPA